MDEIVRIASMTPEDVDTCPSECQFDNLDNYMFFRNLVTMRHHIDSILNCDPAHVDQLLSMATIGLVIMSRWLLRT